MRSPVKLRKIVFSISSTVLIFASIVLFKPLNILAANNCPAGWTCGDIGNPTPTGSSSLNNGVWTVNGGGSDIWGANDQFQFASQPLNGDGVLSAHITSQANTDAWAKAGIMVRQSTAANAAFYFVAVTPGAGINVQYRATVGANALQLAQVSGGPPVYLRVTRSGTSFSAFTSADGTTWTLIAGSTVTVSMTGSVQAGLAVVSHNTAALSAVNFDTVTLVATPTSACAPGGWTCGDIGNPTPAGSTNLNNGVWTVNGGGSDIWGANDQFQFASQPLNGDGVLSAHVTSQTNTNAWAKAGIMLRQNTAANAAFYLVAVTPGAGINVQYRAAAGANALQLAQVSGGPPVSLRVTRSGTSFSAFTSADGTTWTLIAGSTVTMSMTGSVQAGLAVVSHNTAALSAVNFDTVTLVATPTTGCAPGGWTCGDIGNPTPAGSTNLNNGVWTVNGGGSDIYGVTDQFQYASQALSGDGVLSAHVTSQTDTGFWAKAGIMLRQSTAANAAFYLVAVTPGAGITIQYRAAAGANAQQATQVSTEGVWPNKVPAYLRIIRSGASFSAYTSLDGTNWPLVVGSTVTLQMGGQVQAGLAVVSHNTAALSTATFDQVTLTAPPPPVCPNGWTCGDIGNPTTAGSTGQMLNGYWTVNGSGSDIWGTNDQFQYASQPLNGDGVLSAHVTSQANTDYWAKSGIMVRQSTAANAAFYLVAVTPGAGINVQYRATAGANALQLAQVSGGSPVFFRVTRSGTSFSAFTSADGTTWTFIAGSTVTMSMTGSVQAGLAVVSHNTAALSAANFDTVSLTTSPLPSCADVAACPRAADWSQYMHDIGGSNYNSAETTLTASNIANLKPKWTTTGGLGSSAQPIEVNDVVYWGSWDGKMHATNVTGANAGKDMWTSFLGMTNKADCIPPKIGITSTAAYGMVGSTPAIFVGGGGNDAASGNQVYLFALNAATGAVLWKTAVGTGDQDFAWSSPVLYKGSIYYGIASIGDCPLAQGRLYKLDQNTGNIQGTFFAVPSGCVAGGIWGTPTIDTATGILFVSTGTQSSCTGPGDYSASLLEINTTTMNLISSWQIPLSQQIPDGDFGSAPTLFTSGGKPLVGIAHKNGLFYAFDRTKNISVGPIWNTPIATGGTGLFSDGSVVPAAWDGTTLYTGGGHVVINGVDCRGSAVALNPANGQIIWQKCFHDGTVLASATEIPGVVVVTEGPWIYALSTKDGSTLFSYEDPGANLWYYAPVTIANGYMFAVNMDGNFVAFGL